MSLTRILCPKCEWPMAYCQCVAGDAQGSLDESLGSALSKPVEGIGPDGKPATYQFAEGVLWGFRCPDCGDTNGGFIENEANPKSREEADTYSPLNKPCIWCGKGPMQWDGPYAQNKI